MLRRKMLDKLIAWKPSRGNTGRMDAGRVRGIFVQIPGQLFNHETLFILSSVDKGVDKNVKLSLNEEMLVENAVAQQFRANGHRLFFLRSNREEAAKTMEIDFLIVRQYARI